MVKNATPCGDYASATRYSQPVSGLEGRETSRRRRAAFRCPRSEIVLTVFPGAAKAKPLRTGATIQSLPVHPILTGFESRSGEIALACAETGARCSAGATLGRPLETARRDEIHRRVPKCGGN
jgi:hypothetical protein